MPGELLATLAGLSRFLYEEALRNPDWIESIADLERTLTVDEFLQRLCTFPQKECFGSLALFRRKELVRIALRDGLGYGSLAEITLELSNLADAIIRRALQMARESQTERETPRFAVIALGKLGGRELNYSSDIDLMFLHDGREEGRDAQKIAGRITHLLSDYTTAGQAYRVDLRLRPEGTLGELSQPLSVARTYYASRARDWELQMLIKARVAAGDKALGDEFFASVEPLIYSRDVDLSTIEAMSFARERWKEKLERQHQRTRGVNVKLAPGGIRDIEFLVQCLQRLHGARDPEVRHRGTLLAVARLYERGLLSETERTRLTKAYTFLRQVEHRLQLEEDRQVHTLRDTPPHAETLRKVKAHLEDVRSLYNRIVHAQRSLPRQSDMATPHVAAKPCEEPRPFEITPYLSELLQHHPEYAEDLQREADYPARRWVFEGMTAPLYDIDNLRRFFRREMFRIQVASVRGNEPIFETLDRMSALTEFFIARAYRIAREQALAHARRHASPEHPFQEPSNDMSVIALGRLGMREFDIGSDADLVFVIPNSEAPRQQFWTRVAEHLIDILASYTGDAPSLSIDTRLRPNGREGTLVQTESKYVEYFSHAAEAWEGMAYMKARGIAGDTDRTTKFLVELQQVDWRRYGQGGRSKQDLRQMRLRLQREIGNVAPLKAGQGAYYDADFILMYLRLKGAGLFFRSLNTPERIDIVEKMGHLERAEAALLLEGTTFFRALDHAIRVVTGRHEGKLPANKSEREMVARLVRRWTNSAESDVSLEEQIGTVRARMRRLFDSVFN